MARRDADQAEARRRRRCRSSACSFTRSRKTPCSAAIENAGKIDAKKVEAQQARRVLDRLVGYKASPVLWKTVKKGLSAGRVQTVALRLIVEREREIRAFKPVEYWTIEALLEQGRAAVHGQAASHRRQEGRDLDRGRSASAILDDLSGRKTFDVTEVKRRERRKNPSAPFTTSTLQQEAREEAVVRLEAHDARRAGSLRGHRARRRGRRSGLITYMRTDSTRVAESAALQARDYLRTLFGEEFVSPPQLQLYGDGKAKNTQDAHESIRPTDPTRRPDAIKRVSARRISSSCTTLDLAALHGVADDAGRVRHDDGGLRHSVEPNAAGHRPPQLSVPRHRLDREVPGLPRALPRSARGGRAQDARGRAGAARRRGRREGAVQERSRRRSTSPSRRRASPRRAWSRSSSGSASAGRRRTRRSSRCSPTVATSSSSSAASSRRSSARRVEKVMVKQFPDVFNVGFTSEMEGELDKIEEGDLGWQKVLKDFYSPFAARSTRWTRRRSSPRRTICRRSHELRCPDCGGKLEPRGGFFGPFLACENHPKTCKYTRPIKGEKAKPVMTEYKCHVCGAPMVIRHGTQRPVPRLQHVPEVSRHALACRPACSVPKDGGELVERRSKKRGTAFYACSNETCDFVAWNKPVNEKCPECGYRRRRDEVHKTRGDFRKCLKCGNEWDAPKTEEPVERRNRRWPADASTVRYGTGSPPLTWTGVADATPISVSQLAVRRRRPSRPACDATVIVQTNARGPRPSRRLTERRDMRRAVRARRTSPGCRWSCPAARTVCTRR